MLPVQVAARQLVVALCSSGSKDAHLAWSCQGPAASILSTASYSLPQVAALQALMKLVQQEQQRHAFSAELPGLGFLPALMALSCIVPQVAALQAVMSLVQQGQQRHAFDVELFRRALAAALGPALSGALLGVLTGKYMAHADVRCRQ